MPSVLVLNRLGRLFGALVRRVDSVTRDNTSVVVVSEFLGMGGTIQWKLLLGSLELHLPSANMVFVTDA